MKRIVSVNILNLHRFMLCLLAFGISFPDKYIPLLLAGWLLTSIVGFSVGAFEKSREKLTLSHPAILILLFSVWSLFTLLYSSDVARGVDLLVRRLSLVLFAGAIFAPSNPNLNRKTLFFCFVAGNVALMFVVLVKGLMCVYSTPVWLDSLRLDPLPFMKYLFENVKHRSYLSLNLAIALLFLFHLANGSKEIKWSVLLLSISFVFLSAFSFGRISVLIVTMLALFVNLNLWIKSKKIVAVFYFVGVLGVVALITFFHPRLNSVSRSSTEGTPRAELWANAMDLVKVEPFFGHGIGDVESIFNEKNDSEPDSSVAGKKLNAHNQFIDIYLESGFVGEILFIGFIIMLVFKKRFNNQGRFMFAFIWVVCLLFETMLNRIAAVSVLGFTVFLLYNKNIDESSFKINKIYTRALLSVSSLLLVFLVLVSFYMLNSKREINPLDPKTYSMGVPLMVKYENLPGAVPDSIRTACMALKLDSTTNAEIWDGNSNAFFLIDNKKLSRGMDLHAGVYCYVSDDFTGSSVRIVAEGTSTQNRICQYDLLKKGEWQYLSILPEFENGRIPVYLYLTLKNANSFRKMEGYVLFACPTSEVLKIK